MDLDFFNRMRDIHSFVALLEIFESWRSEGVIDKKADEIQMGYISLITYPSIYLTKDSAEKEIAAAKACHEILITHTKDAIKKDLESDDDKAKTNAAILLIPPDKYILSICSEFFHLHYLLKGLYPNYTNEQLAAVNGDDYAKVWLNIFSKGYHFEPTKRAYDADFTHFNEALILISKMHLSPEYKEKMDVEKIKPQFRNYYQSSANNGSGTGCLFSMLFLIITSIAIASFI